MRIRQLADNCFVLGGSVNIGVLRAGDRALLLDCALDVTPAALARLGITHVDRICCTQHRLPNVAGAYAFVATGAGLVVPRAERHLFDAVEAYWADPRNRHHNCHAQPGPQVLPRSLPVAREVAEPDVIEWGGFTIRVLDTPGATDGSLAYVVEAGGERVAFVGDALHGSGRIWDLHSLQKGHGDIDDYHGFLGNHFRLLPSLDKLAAAGARVWVPAHGRPFRRPAAAVALFKRRLDAVWRNYVAISAMNHYFPTLFAAWRDDPLRMPPAPTRPPPPFVRRLPGAAFALIANDGAALVIDCGVPDAVTTLERWLRNGTIKAVEGCWVTHFHDDHVDLVAALAKRFGCPVMADRHLAALLEHPEQFRLPCMSSVPVPAVRATTDGETWRWHEFTLTAWHFPGQTLYHGGLLVEGHGVRTFFAGDSGAPTGLDDYSAGNRNFLGPDRGFRRCFAIWRACRPDLIINQHQDAAFVFDDALLARLDGLLVERELLLAEMLPWPHPDFGTDESWLRIEPYEQRVPPGADVQVTLAITNHAATPLRLAARPLPPPGWGASPRSRSVTVPPRTSGTTAGYDAVPDGRLVLPLRVPRTVQPGRYLVPVVVTAAWPGCRLELGPHRSAIVDVGSPR